LVIRGINIRDIFGGDGSDTLADMLNDWTVVQSKGSFHFDRTDASSYPVLRKRSSNGGLIYINSYSFNRIYDTLNSEAFADIVEDLVIEFKNIEDDYNDAHHNGFDYPEDDMAFLATVEDLLAELTNDQKTAFIKSVMSLSGLSDDSSSQGSSGGSGGALATLSTLSSQASRGRIVDHIPPGFRSRLAAMPMMTASRIGFVSKFSSLGHSGAPGVGNIPHWTLLR